VQAHSIDVLDLPLDSPDSRIQRGTLPPDRRSTPKQLGQVLPPADFTGVDQQVLEQFLGAA
jgi:hypothetical protein